MLFAERLHGPCANKRQEAMTDGLFHGEKQLGRGSYGWGECLQSSGFLLLAAWIFFLLNSLKKLHFQVIYQLMLPQVWRTAEQTTMDNILYIYLYAPWYIHTWLGSP